MSDMPFWLVLIGLEFPAVMVMLDCVNRNVDDFEGGAADRRSWLGWLAVAIVTVPILVGYGIIIGYYFAVIRRNSPTTPS